MKIAGAVALVTGASSGIGAETARELARRGARVILAARRADLLAAQVAAIHQAGGQASAIEADVSDAASIERLARDAEAVYGRIDILVNNAGVHVRGPFAEMAPEGVAQMLDTNLSGAIELTRRLLPAMLQRRSGAIIYVASVAGHIATDPLYSATKYGLRGFALSLRRQLRRSGVSVSIVSPGYVRTPLTSYRRGRLPGPGIIARAIAGLVERPRREVVAPWWYSLAIAVERVAPGLVDVALGRGPSSLTRRASSPAQKRPNQRN
ncbi:MAG TPA: SDR family oxidoreductase [Ktedonobacterales bacterium]|nr:SDR family oxidoreductase [Ktedonobacterales bacterium]